ncbi:hypothetical protein [Embleya sp. NPDC005575]|uniref:hypothetical protein n=1 Tax=Embleya sp. NPDC005575 TaxID=3156892 RepID=UPI0033AD81B2
MSTEQVYTERGARQLDAVRAKSVAADAKASAKVTAAAAKVEAARIKAEGKTAATQARAERREGREQRVARPYVLAMMGACLAAAWPGQFDYFVGLGLGPVMAATLTTVIEGMAWVGIKLTEQGIAAPNGGRPVGRYRAMTWGAATIAAGINLGHGTSAYSLIVGVGLALASLGGPFVHAQYAHAESEVVSGLSGEEIRLGLARRAMHPKVVREAARLRAAVGVSLTPDAAWILAWRSVHGADPGVTARSLKRHHKAADRIGELLAKRPIEPVGSVTASALQTPSASLSALAPGGTVPDADDGVRAAAETALGASGPLRLLLGADADPAPETDGPGRPQPARPDSPTPSRKPGDNRPAKSTDAASAQVAPSDPPPVSVLRELAAESARTASEEQRADARTWIAERIRTGASVAWADVEPDVSVLWGRGRTWYAERLTEVRRAAEPRLHVVPNDDRLTDADVPLPLDVEPDADADSAS